MSAPTPLAKVLCVDDDPGLLRSLRWLLRKQFEVAITDSPTAGLALLAADRFDVVISDLRMPGLSGTAFLERAKVISPRTVRLLLTGYADFGAVLASVNDAEVFRFITKPWDNHKLVQTVTEAARCAREMDNVWTDFSDTFLIDDPGEVDATVLVFDTEADMLADVQAAAPMATRVLWTNDIGDAIGVLTQKDVAVLVTDVAEQRTQQLELIRAVRQHQPGVVVLVYSAERDVRQMARLVNEGQVYRYVPRPGSLHQMKFALRGALSQHRLYKRYPGRANRSALPEPSDALMRSGVDLDLDLDAAQERRRSDTVPMPLPRAAIANDSNADDRLRRASGARHWLRGLFSR